MTTTFPALTPSSRVFTPGEYPATAFNGYSGAQNRVRHSNVFLASQLRLTYKAASEADMLTIWRHYTGTQGSYESFLLPDEAFSGVSIAGYVPSTYRWIYAGPGSVEDLPCGGHNISLTLESVPPPIASVIGAQLKIALSLAAGQAVGNVDMGGISETVNLALTTGAALDAQNGLSESIELGLATGEALNTLQGLHKSIELVLDAGEAASTSGISGVLDLALLTGDAFVDLAGIDEAIDLALATGAGREIRYEVFLSSGTWDWTAAGSPSTVDVLLVGGGGGSTGGAQSNRGGGGGAGGVRIAESISVSGNVTVTVGSGGVNSNSFSVIASNGDPSSFGPESVLGGGAGGSNISSSPTVGGSGGGAGGSTVASTISGAAGTSGQGSAGGNGFGDSSAAPRGGGGGGGKSAAGGNAAASTGGIGGDGITLASVGWDDAVALGAPSAVGGGGGGGGDTPGSGGLGGGAAGSTSGNNPANGAANTGGGAGGPGGGGANGASGGSGLVIVRWIA
jgi:hypothetical protein